MKQPRVSSLKILTAASEKGGGGKEDEQENPSQSGQRLSNVRSLKSANSTAKLLARAMLNEDCLRIQFLLLLLLALQPPLGVVFYSPLVGFSLLACEVS